MRLWMAILSFTGLAVTLAFSEQTKLIDFNALVVEILKSSL